MDFWLISMILVICSAINLYIGYRIGCVQTEAKFVNDEDEVLSTEEIG
jgi:hypothetical protein